MKIIQEKVKSRVYCLSIMAIFCLMVGIKIVSAQSDDEKLSLTLEAGGVTKTAIINSAGSSITEKITIPIGTTNGKLSWKAGGKYKNCHFNGGVPEIRSNEALPLQKDDMEMTITGGYQRPLLSCDNIIGRNADQTPIFENNIEKWAQVAIEIWTSENPIPPCIPICDESKHCPNTTWTDNCGGICTGGTKNCGDSDDIRPKLLSATCGNVTGYAKSGAKVMFYGDDYVYLGSTIADNQNTFNFNFPKYPFKHAIEAEVDCQNINGCQGTFDGPSFKNYNCGSISMAKNDKLWITNVRVVNTKDYAPDFKEWPGGNIQCPTPYYNIFKVSFSVSPEVSKAVQDGQIEKFSLYAGFPGTMKDTFVPIKNVYSDKENAFYVDYCNGEYDPEKYKPTIFVTGNTNKVTARTQNTNLVTEVISAPYDTKDVNMPSPFNLEVSPGKGQNILLFYYHGLDENKLKFYRSYKEDHTDKENIGIGSWAIGDAVGHRRADDTTFDSAANTVYYQITTEDGATSSAWIKADMTGGGNYNPGGIGGQILDIDKVMAELSKVQGTNFTKDTQINNIGEMENLVKSLIDTGVIVIDSNQSSTQKAETIKKIAETIFGQGAGPVSAILERIDSSFGLGGGGLPGLEGVSLNEDYIINGSGSGVATPTPDQNEISLKLNEIFKDINIFEEGATVADLIKKIINLAMALAGLIALVFIIYGGYLYIISSGSPDESKKALQAITQASIGLVLVLASWLIISAVINVFK